jgi:hypothetical protein
MVKGRFCKILYPVVVVLVALMVMGGISRVVEEVHLVEVVVSTVYYSIYIYEGHPDSRQVRVKKEKSEGLFIENESRTMDALLSSIQMSNNTRQILLLQQSSKVQSAHGAMGEDDATASYSAANIVMESSEDRRCGISGGPTMK